MIFSSPEIHQTFFRLQTKISNKQGNEFSEYFVILCLLILNF